MSFRESGLNLRELLSISYLLEAEAVETEPGNWVLRVAYPELPGCVAEGFVIEDALGELERRRIEMIVSLVEAGKEPPVPRKPLAASDPLWAANDLGLSARVAAVLGTPTRQADRPPDSIEEDNALSRRQ
jgi:predicted RNase H-like HicB family nuclease